MLSGVCHGESRQLGTPVKHLFVASVLTVLTITVVAVALQGLFGIGNDLASPAAVGMAIMAPVVAAVFLIGWGLPVHAVLSRQGRSHWGWYAAAGALPAVAFVFGLRPMGDDGVSALIGQSLYFGAIGAAGALVFWFWVVKRSPVSETEGV